MQTIFVRLAAVAAVAALALGAAAPATAQPQPQVTLKFHTFMAPQSHVWRNMHNTWMDKVEKDSGGRIRFERYPAMQLGGTPAQLYDQVKDGVVDVIWTLPGYTAGRFPRVEVFELPFTMTNAEATSRAYWEYVQTNARDEFKDVHVIALHVHGPGLFHSRDKTIKAPSDLRGMKVRGPTRQATRLLATLGASPVGMPLPQIPDALSKGTVEAVATPWEVVPSLKLDELTRSHTEFAGTALYTSVFVLAMNKAKYEALPADLKKVVDANSGIETGAWLGRVQQEGDVPGRKAAEDRKATILTLSGAEADAFRKASDAVDDAWVKEMEGKGINGKQLLESARALIAKHSK